ncbi:hypothetical protein LTR09_001995 [Extremus antarcticus]|uniref:Ubiquitin-like domain-containing protein n=1 Tax=Extremus antarcticus TaxID=702011 RepID=A0AAJ0LVQ8_9PEZI|nr:hypothetical protein LTR09_001995 [Extremus antarcticus]
MAASNVPLDLVIRFSTSNPDVILSIPSPSTTSALSLKQQIRAELDEPASTSRLRLIHSGKVLLDTEALSRTLHITLPPPPRADDNASKSDKAKGKQPLRPPPLQAARVYIHCSVGDVLTPTDLAAEVEAAAKADAALLSASTDATEPAQSVGHNASTTTSTTPAPRGFDRLLTTGFTPAEVATLRTQFLAIQAHTHTPDTMPSGPELLTLEERWLDNGHSPSAGGEEGGFTSDDSGGLEDMLWGNLIGFFWPVGAMFWLMREEGVWTRRRQVAVLSGFLVNITFGFLRVMN